MINRDIFDELFVLELANNHWGDVNRGLRIVKEFSTVVRYNDVRAAIKLQFRDRRHLRAQGFPASRGHSLHQEDARHSAVT